jgi:hypothetical protein
VPIKLVSEVLHLLPYRSHANCAHAYGRAISSSDFSELATLRERASRDRANSSNSGGRGPFKAGMSPVRACSTLARLMIVDVDSWRYVEASMFGRVSRDSDLHVRT